MSIFKLRDLDRLHPDYCDTIEKYLEIIWEHYSERFIGAIVYGSVARGTAQPYKQRINDIDILVFIEQLPGWSSRAKEKIKVENNRPSRIQGIWLTTEDLKGYLAAKTGFILDAFDEGVIVWDPHGSLNRIRKRLFKELEAKGVRKTPRAWVWPIKAGERIEY